MAKIKEEISPSSALEDTCTVYVPKKRPPASVVEYPCDKCDFVTNSARNLKYHMDNNHLETRYSSDKHKCIEEDVQTRTKGEH